MIAKAVRGRPPEPARKLQVCLPATVVGSSQRRKARRCSTGVRLNCMRSRTAGRAGPRARAGGGGVVAAGGGGGGEPVPAAPAARGGRRCVGGQGHGHGWFCLS